MPDDKLPPAWCCFIPFVVIVILLNVFKMNIVVCLLAGILLSLVFLFLMGKVRGSVYLTNVGETCNKGCQSAVSAIMNTAAAVGFGSVVKITPGFAFLSELVLGIGGSPLIAESIAINVLAGATGAPPPAVSRSPWTLWRITLFRCPRPPAFLWRCSTGLAPSPAAD